MEIYILTETPTEYQLPDDEVDSDENDPLVAKLKALNVYADSCDRRLLTMIKLIEISCDPIIPLDADQLEELEQLAALLKQASDFARQMKFGHLPKFKLEEGE